MYQAMSWKGITNECSLTPRVDASKFLEKGTRGQGDDIARFLGSKYREGMIRCLRMMNFYGQRRNDFQQFLGASCASCKLQASFRHRFTFTLRTRRGQRLSRHTVMEPRCSCAVEGVMKCYTAMHGNVLGMSDMMNSE